MADLPCPTCGSPLTFLDQYQRYYCHRCLAYAPEGYGDHGAQTCHTCGGILSYVRQYGRMYCYRCNAYPPEPSAAEPKRETPTEAPAQPTSDQPSTGASSAETAATALLNPPKPVETTVVATATPIPEVTPEPESKPEPEEIASAPPETTQSAAAPVTSDAGLPSTPAAQLQEATPPPPSKEMQILAASKPAAIRVKLFALKRPDLVDLCRIYNLDTGGSKEEIQQRLLAYLHDVESEGGPREPSAASVTPPEAFASETPPSSPMEGTRVPAAGSAPSQAATPTVVEETTAQPSAAAGPAPILVTPTPAPAEGPHAAPKVEHPCPTCGRELTYISQYNRWYCYYCQRYAPAAARAKHACPTCGATMRWIDQHQRWWCDSCQKYASADLPPPGGLRAAAATADTATVSAASRAVVIHRHGSPVGGAGLIGFGLALYVVYAFFAYLGGMMGIVTPSGITPEMLNLLQFLAILFLAIGAIAGLYGMRDRT